MKSFEQAFAEVEALINGTTPPTLRRDILDLAKDRGLERTLKEIHQALAAGVPPMFVIEFLEVAAIPMLEGPGEPSLLQRATGSTGKALPDGTARGIIAAALGGVLTFLQVEYDLLSAAGVAALVPVVLGASFLLAGVWDRYVKPRLR